MKAVIKIAAFALALSSLPGAAAPGVHYDADCLESMVGKLKYSFDPDVEWAAADTTIALDYQGRGVRIDVAGGRVVHVGYRLFSDQQREAMPYTTLFNFLERYSLDADLPGKRKKSVEKMLAEDDVTCSSAGFRRLPTVASDTTLAISVVELNSHRYRVEWSDGSGSDAAYFIELPIDYDLLHSTDMIERERRLVADLEAWPTPAVAASTPLASREGLVSNYMKGYYILPGDSYLLDNLTTNRYYRSSVEADSLLTPIFDESYPIESLATLLTTGEVANDFMLEMKIDCYGAIPTVGIGLSAALDYFRSHGCTAYFGVGSYDAPMATCYLVLRNAAEGYCHLLRVEADTSILPQRVGTVKARLNPYIPMSRVATLFDESSPSTY